MHSLLTINFMRLIPELQIQKNVCFSTQFITLGLGGSQDVVERCC